MSTQNAMSDRSQERRSKYFWITLILGFFALDLTIAIIAIVMAAGDPSFRPMPDYGDRSVEWEVHHQARLSAAKLGWSVSVSAVEPDRKSIDYFVVDRIGVPIVKASGSTRAYHLTRVSQEQTSPIEEIEPGRYRARIDCKRPGLWKIELRMHRKPESSSQGSTLSEASNQEDVFIYESTIEL